MFRQMTCIYYRLHRFLGAMILCGLSISVYGQDIRIRETSPKSDVVDLDLGRYDGQDPFFKLEYLKDHPNYYDGAQILFLPNKEKRYDYVERFLHADPSMYITVSDTIWNKNRTRIREINTTRIDVYKAEKIENGSVKVFGSDIFSNSGTISIKSGYSTPRTAIEGKAFTIKSCTVNQESRNGLTMYDFSLILSDSEGVDIVWPVSYWIYGSSKQFIPVIMYSFFQQYEQYVGRTFVNTVYYKEGNIERGEQLLKDEYKCTEISFIDDDTIYDHSSIGHYYAPVLYFDHNGKEEHFNILPERNYGWMASRSSMSKFIFQGLTDKELFLAKIETEKRALALKEKEDSLANAAQLTLERRQALARQQKEKADREVRLQKEKEEREALSAQKRAERYARLINDYGENNAKLMLDGEVKIGWTQQMCRESWGAPSNINKTTTSNKVHEQWVYRRGYLYFENGILTTIQN